MRVVLNLIPVQSGGGQTQALNLLTHLSTQPQEVRDAWLILVGTGSTLHRWLERRPEFQYRDFSSGYLKLFVIDRRKLRNTVRSFRADVIYHFTAAWRGLATPQVVRSVYSNLYFPEIPFWPKRPLTLYWKKKLIDRFRLAGTLRADGLLFENRAMQDRAISMFGYPQDRTCYVKPSRATDSTIRNAQYRPACDRRFRVLYLSSWYRNKNIHMLPAVAAALRDERLDVCFVLSLDPSHPDVRRDIVQRSTELGVAHYFEFVGTVHPAAIPELVASCDAMILLSQLECFSSNVVEAWTYERPLVISDREWAHAECEDAAVYVDRDSAEDIARGIAGLARSQARCAALVQSGVERLKAFNTLESKADEQIAFLRRIVDAGKRT